MTSDGHKDDNVLIQPAVYQLPEMMWKWQNCVWPCGN